MRLRVIVVSGAWVAASSCSRPTTPSGAAPSASTPAAATAPGVAGKAADCERLFQPPAGAEALCDQHDLATDAEVHWRSFGSRDPRPNVEARYRELARKCGAAIADEPAGLSLTQGPWHLSTHDARTGKFPSCARVASPEHQTVVLISSMFKR